MMALHVLDAMMLGSTDISALPFNERLEKILHSLHYQQQIIVKIP